MNNTLPVSKESAGTSGDMIPENTDIDISGLNKAEVLAALFNASKQQGMGLIDKSGASPMTIEDAEKEIGGRKAVYFDYLRGRVMKINLSDHPLQTYLYDRDNGQGAAAAALAPLLAKVE